VLMHCTPLQLTGGLSLGPDEAVALQLVARLAVLFVCVITGGPSTSHLQSSSLLAEGTLPMGTGAEANGVGLPLAERLI